jgi:hypothetical protein
MASPTSDEGNRFISEDVRTRALERLYDRKTAVEDLILAFEKYQRTNELA